LQKKNGLDYNRLQNDRHYKEQFRLEMVAHHKSRNDIDPLWAIKQVVTNAIEERKQIILLSDLRTHEDLISFHNLIDSAPFLIRINAKDSARLTRGWDPHPQKDALHTEVDLDNYTNWDACFSNDDNSTETGESIVREWITTTVIPRIAKRFVLNKNE